MSTQTIECISNIKKGSFNWRIKVRLIRMWRNITSMGDLVKGLNILLLDDKDVRIHAYIPDDIEKKVVHLLYVGEIYLISNFMVKEYRDQDKFLPIRSEKQIKFTDYTKVKQLDEEKSLIDCNAFDLYDIGELKNVQQMERYLIDVAGIIEEYQPLRNYISKQGKPTRDTRFVLSDGRCSVKVTFWGTFAEEFSNAMEIITEKPVILIIASARVQIFQGTPQLKDHAATRYYINAQHYSVLQLRTMFSDPSFTQRHVCRQSIVVDKIFSVRELKEISNEYIGKQIITMVTVRKIDFSNKWFYYECTGCFAEISFVENKLTCPRCVRNVKYPNMKFHIFTICSDENGGIGIIMCDREIRILTGKTVEDYIEYPSQNAQATPFPVEVKDILYRDLTLLLEVTESNVRMHSDIFTANDVMEGHNLSLSNVWGTSYSQAATSSAINWTQERNCTNSEYHLDNLSGSQTMSPTNLTYGKTSRRGKQVIHDDGNDNSEE